MTPFACVAVAIIAIPWLVVAVIDIFSCNYDSIYDPRSKFQIWRDGK